jgi:hypothetical protein
MYVIKGLPLQYDDDGTLYTIWTYDNNEVLICQIYKDAVPESALTAYSQETNDADKSDFETNFKPLGNTPLDQIDTDGAHIFRIKAAKRGWSYWAIPVEFTTSTLLGSLHCKTSDNTDIPWVNCKIYNGSDQEITTAGLLNANLNTCVKTVLDFEPTFNYEIIGGSLRVNSNPAQDVRVWIVGAPDIPAIYGGSKEFASGINVKFLAADNVLQVDGRVTKALIYNATDHRGKMRIIIKHPAGLQVNFMLILELYRQ